MEKRPYIPCFKETKELINPKIQLYLYALIKSQFFEGSKNITSKVTKITRKIEEKYRIDITSRRLDNSNPNIFIRIAKFVQLQNSLFFSEILENIIIKVLSLAFQTKNSDFFGKYIYNNLKGIRDNKDFFDTPWINKKNLTIFRDREKKDILKDILNYDAEFFPSKENKSNSMNIICQKNDFVQLLVYLKHMSYTAINNTEKFNLLNDNNEKTVRYDSETSIFSFASELIFDKTPNITARNYRLPLVFSLLVAVYIYYQNKNSPLMFYSQQNNNLSNPGFTYEFSEAGIIYDFNLGILIKPIRIETRIKNVELNKNKFGFESIFELHKALLFNKRIKSISMKSCAIKSKYLASFSENMKFLKNRNIEKLDMTSNYLKCDADIYLAKLISFLRGLKSLSLSYNYLKSGVAPLFVTLKNLYRQNKTKLETLVLINCNLDDISFYELGELLKSKYCKLKCLCLSENNIPSDVNFFNALKKNRSLKELFIYGCGISSDKVDSINKIISNTNLRCLYINDNKIYDFNQYISILYRNILIKLEEEKGRKDNLYDIPCLYNLNMNEIDCFNRNSQKMKIIKEGIDRTNISLLDMTSVLNGFKFNNTGNKDYFDEINIIVKDLNSKQEKYKNCLKDILENEVDVLKYKKQLGEDIKAKFFDLEDRIENIINDPNSKKNLFITRKAEEIKRDLLINSNEDDNEFKDLIKYIHYRRAEKILKGNQIIKAHQKMILI